MKVSKDAGSDELWLGDKFPKELPVHLTDKEREERAKEMSGAQIELTGLEEEKKETMKDFAARMKPLQQLVKNLAPVVNTGIEQRPVTVRWRQEIGASSAVLVRLDTLEALEDTRRALNPAELEGLQATLGFGRDGSPVAEETPPSLLDEVLSQGVALGRSRESSPLIMPGHGPGSKPLGKAITDYRKAPANANRGATLCDPEESHEYGPPDAEGWESCRKCPCDRRLVVQANPPSLTDMGEEDLSESQAALDALEAGSTPPTLRWPLGDTMWMLSVEEDKLWFHSPELASSSSRRHGPGGWVPTNHGAERIVSWTFGGSGELREVPLIVIAQAVSLLDSGAEGLKPPRPMAEVKAVIAAERAEDMESESWGDEQRQGPPPEHTALVAALQGEPPPAESESPGADLTDLAAAFLIALLNGPLMLDAIRAMTNNRRVGATAKSLGDKGFVEADEEPDRYRLTSTGRQTAELLKKAKEGRRKGTRKA